MSGTLAGQRVDRADPASVPPAGFEPARMAPEGACVAGLLAGHRVPDYRCAVARPRAVHGHGADHVDRAAEASTEASSGVARIGLCHLCSCDRCVLRSAFDGLDGRHCNRSLLTHVDSH